MERGREGGTREKRGRDGKRKGGRREREGD